MSLRGDSVRLRPVVEADLDRLAEIDSDEEAMGLMEDGPVMPRRAEGLAKWLIEPYGGRESYPFAVERLEDGALIGSCNLNSVNWRVRSAFVGISMSRETWGTGVGTEAMRLLVDFAFGELNLHRIALTVWEHNPRAIASYEKLGFATEGRLRDHLYRQGRFWDKEVYGLLAAEHAAGALRPAA